MEQITKIAKIILDFVIITLLMAISFALVLPFCFMFVGVVGYFSKNPEERTLKTIFQSIGENIKILWRFAFIVTLLLGVSIFDIAFLSLPAGWIQSTILWVSWSMLVVGMFLLMAAPAVIIRMRVTFKELIINSLILLVSGTWKTLLLAILFGAACYVGFVYPIALGACFYFVLFADAIAMNAMIDNLKRKGEKKDEKVV